MRKKADRYALISHTRTLFKMNCDRKYVLENIHYNYGEDCPFLNEAMEEYDRLELKKLHWE